jgi:hypothetical protein
MDYECEQCGHGAALCVSDWGYIAALCDDCLKERKGYMKLPGSDGDRCESRPRPGSANRPTPASR